MAFENGSVVQLTDDTQGSMPIYPVVLTTCLRNPDGSDNVDVGAKIIIERWTAADDNT